MDTFVTFVAATPPNVTTLVPMRFCPVMVTDVPPAAGPDAGLRTVMTGVGR